MTKFCALIVLSSIIHVSTSMLVGGWSSFDCNSDSFKEIADFATEEISSRNNCLYHMRPIKVENCSKQVVSGINYRMEILIGVTECKKNAQYSDEAKKRCPMSCEAPKNCSATVWDQPWRNNKKLTNFSCQTQNEVDRKPC